jgi:hypothetical protein
MPLDHRRKQCCHTHQVGDCYHVRSAFRVVFFYLRAQAANKFFYIWGNRVTARPTQNVIAAHLERLLSLWLIDISYAGVSPRLHLPRSGAR